MLSYVHRLWHNHATDEYSLWFVLPHQREAFSLLTRTSGQLVGTFTGYFMEDGSVTQADFQREINRLALLITYLFIAKFVLSYFSLVSTVTRLTRIRANDVRTDHH